MDKTRTRTSDEKCPKCDEPIVYHEYSPSLGGNYAPERWQVTYKECSAGCELTDDDFPKDGA